MFLCNIHGKYLATKTSNECPSCRDKKAVNRSLIGEEFIKKARKIHKNRYSYGEFVFVDFMTPGIIRCKTHGQFEMSPAVHIFHRAKCPKCSGSISKGEVEWLDEMERTTGRKIERNGMLIIGNKSIRPDGIDRERRLVFEYLGSYWHGSPLKYKANDYNQKAKKTFGTLFLNTLKRESLIKTAGYKVIKIWDYEWEAQKKKRKK